MNISSLNSYNTSMLFSSLSRSSSSSNLTNAFLGGSSFLGGTNNMASLTSSVLNGSNGSNMLTDYALVKSGSYGKLLRAYYSSVEDESSVSAKEESNKSNSTATYDEKGSKATQIQTSELYDIFV